MHEALRTRQHTGQPKDLARGSEVVSALVAHRVDVLAVVVALYIKEHLREPGMQGRATVIRRNMDRSQQACGVLMSPLCRGMHANTKAG